MYRKIFNHIKKIIPKVSETEIFQGQVNLKNLFKPIKTTNNLQITDPMNIKTIQLLRKIGPDPVYPSSNIMNTMGTLGSNGFLA